MHLLTRPHLEDYGVFFEDSVRFFDIDLPFFLVAIVFATYLGVFTYLGCKRRFRHESEALFTVPGGASFLSGWCVLCAGLTYRADLWSQTEAWQRMSELVFLTTTPLPFVSAAARKNVGRYLELRQHYGCPLTRLWWKVSNLRTMSAFAAVVFGVQLVFALGQGLSLGTSHQVS